MKDPPQNPEAIQSDRDALARTEGYIALILRIQAKIRFIRIMGAMGAAGLSMYFAQDYNISQLIPGE